MSALRDCAHAVPARHATRLPEFLRARLRAASREATHAAHGAPNSAARRASPAFLPARDTLRFSARALRTLCTRPVCDCRPGRTPTRARCRSFPVRQYVNAGYTVRFSARALRASQPAPCVPSSPRPACQPARALRASQPAPCVPAGLRPAPVPAPHPAPPLSAPGPALCASGPAPALHRKKQGFTAMNPPCRAYRLPKRPGRYGAVLCSIIQSTFFKSCSAGSTLSSTYSPSRGALSLFL